MPKEDSHCICVSVILTDYAVKIASKSYYPQAFLEECKYLVKKNKQIN